MHELASTAQFGAQITEDPYNGCSAWRLTVQTTQSLSAVAVGYHSRLNASRIIGGGGRNAAVHVGSALEVEEDPLKCDQQIDVAPNLGFTSTVAHRHFLVLRHAPQQGALRLHPLLLLHTNRHFHRYTFFSTHSHSLDTFFLLSFHYPTTSTESTPAIIKFIH